MISHADSLYVPRLVGTQFTSWNFFAWMTRTEGNEANRPCLIARYPEMTKK